MLYNVITFMNAYAHSVLIWLAVGNCVAVLVVITDKFDKYLFGIVLTSIFFTVSVLFYYL